MTKRKKNLKPCEINLIKQKLPCCSDKECFGCLLWKKDNKHQQIKALPSCPYIEDVKEWARNNGMEI